MNNSTPEQLRRRSRLVETKPSRAPTSVSSSSSHENGGEANKFNNNSKKKSFSLLKLISLILLPLFLSVMIILIGAEIEQRAITKAQLKSTLDLYTKDDQVCATSDSSTFQTYSNAQDVPENYSIAHCGACSNCSTMHDMTIYAGTTKTLTNGATICSTRGYLASLFLWRGLDVYRRVAKQCLEENVGFTEDCAECWLDDMECGIQACVFMCLKSVYLLREPKNDPITGQLNQCLACDEKLCGPDFLACSGSNRRRQGIHSDIARGGAELCQSVTMDWESIGGGE